MLGGLTLARECPRQVRRLVGHVKSGDQRVELLGSPANRAAVVAELVAKAKAGGFDAAQDEWTATRGDPLR